MKNNWLKNWESNSDEKWEKNLKSELEAYLKKLDDMRSSIEYSNNKKLRVILKKIDEIYHTMKVQGFDYNEEEYEILRKEIAEVEYKIKEEDKEDKDSESWEDYKKEEEEEER